jgi:HK97 family phage prohead protease
MEYKSLPQFTKEITDRTVTGVFAIHGNVDEGGDRSWPGSFANIAVNGRMRARFVWQHRTDEPPVAVIKSVREIDRTALPQSVLGFAPDASGGVEVTREYLNTPRGNEILEGIKAGAIDEMSYAYDVTRSDFEQNDERGQIRNIREVKLFDISDVLWGMNPATVGSKSLPLEIEHQTALAAVDNYIKRYQSLAALRAKEGRVLSGDNRKRIESAVEALAGASTALKDLLTATEPQKDSGADLAEAQKLFAQFQRTAHYLNGVLHT